MITEKNIDEALDLLLDTPAEKLNKALDRLKTYDLDGYTELQEKLNKHQSA